MKLEKTVTTFIKQQQELARTTVLDLWPNDDEITQTVMREVDTLITQIITNAGEELQRLAEEEAVAHKDGGLVMLPAHKVFEHITKLTGVE